MASRDCEPGRKLVFTGASSQARRVAVALDALAGATADAVTEFEVGPDAIRIEIYFTGQRAARAALEELKRLLPDEIAMQVGIEAVPDRNWAAEVERHLAPVRAGRFLVHGSHDRSAARGLSRAAIEIDAGLAFGTARHATTSGCLEALDLLLKARSFGRVLDLGCGTGVLAIAAARRLPRASITASDIDPVAVEVASVNARANRVAARVRTVAADGLCGARLAGPFDLILANILAEPLRKLAPAMARRLSAGGIAVLSGLLRHEAASVTAAYRAAGLTLLRRLDRAGWSVLVLARR